MKTTNNGQELRSTRHAGPDARTYEREGRREEETLDASDASEMRSSDDSEQFGLRVLTVPTTYQPLTCSLSYAFDLRVSETEPIRLVVISIVNFARPIFLVDEMTHCTWRLRWTSKSVPWTSYMANSHLPTTKLTICCNSATHCANGSAFAVSSIVEAPAISSCT